MTKKIANNIVEVISLEEFTSIVSKYEKKENVFYRGQKDKGYNISCSLSREDGYVKNENNMIAEALEQKPKEFESYKTPIEILSKMQHYEIPTRLVDVTIDPYIALYFAIEDAKHNVDAEVFIFEKTPHAINSKDVNLVSLLSISEDYSFKGLVDLYEKTYNEKISESQVATIIEENKLVEFNESLSHSNERLYNQKGTFILCSNVIKNDVIKQEIKEISKDDTSCIIRIPFEYKNFIKDELNKRYNINQHMIYPELPVFAKYIKEKFKTRNNKSINDYNFTIIEEHDVSHRLAKRLSIKLELEYRMPIEAIKAIIHSIVEKYSCKYDVLWIYVSSSKEDTVIYNWTVQALWIDSSLSKTARPYTSGNLEYDGIYWTYGRGLTSMREYYEKNVFEEDNKLLELNYNELQNIKHIYRILKKVFNEKSFNEFLDIINKHKKEVNEIYCRFQEFGISRTPEISKYLHIYQQIACDFDNIVLVSNRYLLSRYFNSLDKNINEAESKYEYMYSICNGK